MNAQHEDTSLGIRASVCMATYNGAEYVAEQIESIMRQLGPNDELVIVDDASPDTTVEVVRTFSDDRVTVLQAGQNQGYVRSFEQAVLASKGEYVFLADQDDVWLPGRLAVMLRALQGADVVASNFAVLDDGDRGKVPLLRAADSGHHARNIAGILVGYRPYYGCGMAMTRAQARVFTPVPSYLKESHDLWLALCGNVAGSMAHLDEPTLLRRLHGNNVTPTGWRSLRRILQARLMIFRALLEAGRRTKASKRSAQQAA
ncbi:MAG: glycosyltransferase family 2 protein [Actinomycetota bacterium]|nr:glycosyltransferase family 2 protein [Actinomycetota bacterium]